MTTVNNIPINLKSRFHHQLECFEELDDLEERVSRSTKKVCFKDEANQIHPISSNSQNRAALMQEVDRLCVKGDRASDGGDFEKALRIYNKAMQKVSLNRQSEPNKMVKILDDIGLTLIELERLDEGRAILESTHAICYTDTKLRGTIYEHLAIVHHELGNDEKSRDFYLRAHAFIEKGTKSEFEILRKIVDLSLKIEDKETAKRFMEFMNSSQQQ